jgi:predicted amidophosphoribosyltransferase
MINLSHFPQLCPACSAMNPGTAKYCGKCGSPIDWRVADIAWKPWPEIWPLVYNPGYHDCYDWIHDIKDLDK